jgi:hypothetical protein
VAFQVLAHDAERRPEALLAHVGAVLASAPLAAWLAGRQDGGAVGELCDGGVEAVGAELVAGAVRRLALHAVAPALVGVVDDRRRLTGLERERQALRGDDLLPVMTLGHVDDVPVVQVEQFARVPLHVVAGPAFVAADVVRVD